MAKLNIQHAYISHKQKSARLLQILCHRFYKTENEETLYTAQCHLTDFTQDVFVCWNSQHLWETAWCKLITDKICHFYDVRDGPPKHPFCKMTLIQKFTLCPHLDREHFLQCRGFHTAMMNKNVGFWLTRMELESRVVWNQSRAQPGLLGAVREWARVSVALLSSWPGGQAPKHESVRANPRLAKGLDPESLQSY